MNPSLAPVIPWIPHPWKCPIPPWLSGNIPAQGLGYSSSFHPKPSQGSLSSRSLPGQGIPAHSRPQFPVFFFLAEPEGSGRGGQDDEEAGSEQRRAVGFPGIPEPHRRHRRGLPRLPAPETPQSLNPEALEASPGNIPGNAGSVGMVTFPFSPRFYGEIKGLKPRGLVGKRSRSRGIPGAVRGRGKEFQGDPQVVTQNSRNSSDASRDGGPNPP